MPNYCIYDLMAVSKNKETLERLIKIMSYDDGFCYVGITGTVAWSCHSWFETEEDTARTLGEDYPGREKAHYISLDLLCKRLDIAIDCFGEETGCEFQEHFIVNNNGELLVNECVEYHEYVDDDTGRVVSEGVFGDEYLEFRDFEDLYVDVKPE